MIESMLCKTSAAAATQKQFVRININDGIVAVPGCTDGPGSSCPLEKFLEQVQRRLRDAGDFKKVCGLPDDSPDGISFFHQN